MNVPQKVTLPAILLGALALIGHPVLAVAADPGSETSMFAQVQGQQDEETTSGQPADQPPAAARRGMGAGMMGGEDGMMDPQMMMRMHGGTDKGMTGGGMGPMGPCPMMMARVDKDFSAEQVRDILEGQIAWTGNKRLKVGGVEQKDEETYVAEIVTVDDSLVQRVEVNRNTGAMRPID
jgi:hypothetical protein